MAEELIELGKKGTRVCVKIVRARGGYILSEYDARTRKHKNYIGPKCKRVKSRKRALLIMTKKAAQAKAGRCKINRCRI